ncbi:MAG: hypothetical protein WAS07_11030 [Micropruina sp.]|nr:hypothetical protein [Micropruina sp.]
MRVSIVGELITGVGLLAGVRRVIEAILASRVDAQLGHRSIGSARGAVAGARHQPSSGWIR